MSTIRILISLVALFNWELQQFDVKNFFLHSDLKEDVFMKLSPGFEESFKNKICRLESSIRIKAIPLPRHGLADLQGLCGEWNICRAWEII